MKKALLIAALVLAGQSNAYEIDVFPRYHKVKTPTAKWRHVRPAFREPKLRHRIGGHGYDWRPRMVIPRSTRIRRSSAGGGHRQVKKQH